MKEQEKFIRLCKAEYALGYREDKPIRKMLPAWPFEEVSLQK